MNMKTITRFEWISILLVTGFITIILNVLFPGQLLMILPILILGMLCYIVFSSIYRDKDIQSIDIQEQSEGDLGIPIEQYELFARPEGSDTPIRSPLPELTDSSDISTSEAIDNLREGISELYLGIPPETRVILQESLRATICPNCTGKIPEEVHDLLLRGENYTCKFCNSSLWVDRRTSELWKRVNK